jgi:hypothetical protein
MSGYAAAAPLSSVINPRRFIRHLAGEGYPNNGSTSQCGGSPLRCEISSRLRSAMGLGCAKTPALAPHVEISLINCISESQNILQTRGSMPCWRTAFSTFREYMSFYTARVISRPHAVFSPCPLCPRKQTKSRRAGRSASCHLLPFAPQQITSLFDHLVGAGEQRRWDFEAERLGSFEVSV